MSDSDTDKEQNYLIDKCVKCECKFTTPDKPLKLLPCLHSMCLDCLSGRIPIKAVKKKSPPKEEKQKEESNLEKAASISDASVKPSDDNGILQTEPSNSDAKPVDESSDSSSAKDAEPKPTSNLTGSAKEDDKEKGNQDSGDNAETESSEPAEEQNSSESDKEKDAKDPAVVTTESTIAPTSPTIETVAESKDMTSENVDDSESASKSETESTEEQQSDEPIDEKPKPLTECPVCRDPIEQPFGANLLDNMFATLEPDKPESPEDDVQYICTACDEGQEAPYYCMQCEEWLCDSCVDAHRRVRVTKDHTIVPKDEVQTATAKSPWEHQMMCKQHKMEELKFFCERCEKLTCRDCQLLDHKDHKYQFLDQAAEQYKQRLRGSLALMGEKRTKLASNRDEIEQKLKNCKEQKETLQQDILKQTDILVKGIRTAVWGVLGNLASFTDAANKRLNKEIDDVSDLVGKFDHCIHFMEDILREGSSMSLLYSKGSVETKCRKVYHTQVDPQSLKGTLTIQYKHDVNWLLGNLSKIGSIFVNGQRYPPDKNGRSSGGSGGGGAGVTANSQPVQPGFQDNAGLSATSTHLQHMANQVIPGQRVPSDWNKYIQQVASKPGAPQGGGPPNMTIGSMAGGALPPQLTLPSNRRGGAAAGIPPQWTGPPGMPGATFPGHFVAGQLLTPQQQQGSQRPSFTPMRLHHRPATQNPFAATNEHATAGAVPSRYNRQGSEASGTSRQSHGTPDPARPASAGMYNNDSSGPSRPDSGGPALVDVKKERRDRSPDCVIMASNMKSSGSPAFQNKQSDTALEMQRNLDEVLRAVPMDLSDNMEHISGFRPRTSVQSSHNTTAVPRPADTAARPASLATVPEHPSLGKGGYTTNGGVIKEAPPPSPSDQELRDNWQGGNSMPGFSLAQADSQGDPNDDYCACCHNGGDVLCCDRCPRVFHLQCHIPEMAAVPSGSFLCTICEGDEPVTPEETIHGKRKAAGGLTDAEITVCERILLELFCHPSSVPFQEPVNKEQVPNYYKIIMQPMDLTQIKAKLQRKSPNHYQSVKACLWDLRQVFINCAIYNKSGSEVGKAGKMVREVFEGLVARLVPQYLTFVQEDPTPCFSALQRGSLVPEDSDGATVAKRPRVEGDS